MSNERASFPSNIEGVRPEFKGENVAINTKDDQQQFIGKKGATTMDWDFPGNISEDQLKSKPAAPVANTDVFFSRNLKRGESDGQAKQSVPIPTQDRVLITTTKPETQTAGGIIIPTSVINENNRGYVVAVGPLVGQPITRGDNTLYPKPNTTVKPGDLVIFGQYSGTETSYNGVDYMVMRESDILAILP